MPRTTERDECRENMRSYPMSLTSLESQVSELVNSGTCSRPTTTPRATHNRVGQGRETRGANGGAAPAQASCRGIHDQWEAVEQKHGDKALSCVYSSYPRTHPGWRQWRPGCGRVEDSMHNVYILWATRWWVAL